MESQYVNSINYLADLNEELTRYFHKKSIHQLRKKKQNLAEPKVRKRFVTYKEATNLYSMGLTRVQEHARSAGATYKMGNKVLVNTDIFEAYLEQFRIPGEYEGMARKFTPDLAVLMRNKGERPQSENPKQSVLGVRVTAEEHDRNFCII